MQCLEPTTTSSYVSETVALPKIIKKYIFLALTVKNDITKKKLSSFEKGKSKHIRFPGEKQRECHCAHT